MNRARAWALLPILTACAASACGGAPPAASRAAEAPAASVVSPALPSPSDPPSSAITGVAPDAPLAPARPSGPVAPATTGQPASADRLSPDASAPAGRGASAKAPEKITARHVLIQWMGCDHAPASVVRTRDQAHAVAEEVLRKAKAGADFARLALDYSDEPNASARGGSLGRFGHGQMVKAFEEAAFALAPGEISGIVESPFGYHVIQRTE